MIGRRKSGFCSRTVWLIERGNRNREDRTMNGYKTKKLVLNTETLRNLEDAELRQVVGGAGSDVVQATPSTDGGANSGCTVQALQFNTHGR
jgi:hypothetical protein